MGHRINSMMFQVHLLSLVPAALDVDEQIITFSVFCESNHDLSMNILKPICFVLVILNLCHSGLLFLAFSLKIIVALAYSETC